jgi:hypothetical protein
MGIFDVFSKKREESVDLPPPPMPDMDEPHMMEFPEAPQDIEPVSAPDMHEEVMEEEHSPLMETPEPMMPRMRSSKGPLFVSVQDYQAILDGVNSIRSKLSATEDSFRKLHEVKASQDKGLEDWRASLEDIQRKLTYVDEVLFGR